MKKFEEITIRQELEERGFKFICKNQDNLEVWAKFTGFEDNIQWTYYREDIPICGIQTTDFNKINLFRNMFDKMNEEFLDKIYDNMKDDFNEWR